MRLLSLPAGRACWSEPTLSSNASWLPSRSISVVVPGLWVFSRLSLIKPMQLPRAVCSQEPFLRQDPLRSGPSKLEPKLDFLRVMLKRMADAGVELVAGTDAPGVPGTLPGFSLHDDLAELERSGLTAYQVLSTATRAPGDFIVRTKGGEPFGQNPPGISCGPPAHRRQPALGAGDAARAARCYGKRPMARCDCSAGASEGGARKLSTRIRAEMTRRARKKIALHPATIPPPPCSLLEDQRQTSSSRRRP